MKRATIVLVLLLSMVALAVREEGGTGILAHDYSLKAPEGWIFDDESLVESGMQAAIYPKGSDVRTTLVKVVSGTYEKSDGETLADFIARERQSFVTRNPRIKFETLPSLTTEDQHTALVRKMTGEGNRIALIAYLEARPGKVHEIVLWSSPDRLAQATPAFEYVVASFQLVND